MPEMSLAPTAEAGRLLQGSTDRELKKRELNDQESQQNVANVSAPISSGLDYAGQLMKDKTLLMGHQLQAESRIAGEQIKLQAQQERDNARAIAKKAEIDYRDFFTMTPELADGIFKTSNGRLDFRKNVGQRYKTNVIMPLAQLYGRQIEKSLGGGKGSQKDLNALKAFVKTYEDEEKAINDPLKIQMAKRNPKLNAQLMAKTKEHEAMAAKYKEAKQKIGNIGGLSDDGEEEGASAAPPATSASDEDALIDRAFQ